MGIIYPYINEPPLYRKNILPIFSIHHVKIPPPNIDHVDRHCKELQGAELPISTTFGPWARSMYWSSSTSLVQPLPRFGTLSLISPYRSKPRCGSVSGTWNSKVWRRLRRCIGWTWCIMILLEGIWWFFGKMKTRMWCWWILMEP